MTGNWPARAERLLWALTLVALPLTSFRFLPFFGAGTQVRPLAFLPAALLLAFLLWRCWRERRLVFWHTSMTPLLGFALAALAATAAGLLLAPVDVYGQDYAGRALRAWVTLGVGLVFLFTAVAMNRTEADLRFSLRWLFVGFAAHVAWSGVQVAAQYLPQGAIPGLTADLVDNFQKTFSMAGLAPQRRISGLALEPSWLAAQIAALYLPWAFAALLKGYSLSRWRWLELSVLAAGFALLVLTYSRSGLATTLAALAVTFALAGGPTMRAAWAWFWRPFNGKPGAGRQRSGPVALRAVLAIGLMAGLAGGLVVLFQNEYFAALAEANLDSLEAFFTSIYAGPRLAYAQAALDVFAQHPLTGVGLGAAGFYLFESLPDWARFNNLEVSRYLSPQNTVLLNPKNLYARLLAETGLAGFWFFTAFYLGILGLAGRLLRSRDGFVGFAGTAGLCAWLSIIALGFSQDSLAMAAIWLPLGMVIGIAAGGKQNQG